MFLHPDELYSRYENIPGSTVLSNESLLMISLIYFG